MNHSLFPWQEANLYDTKVMPILNRTSSAQGYLNSLLIVPMDICILPHEFRCYHVAIELMQKRAAEIVGGFLTDYLGEEMAPWQSAESAATAAST